MKDAAARRDRPAVPRYQIERISPGQQPMPSNRVSVRHQASVAVISIGQCAERSRRGAPCLDGRRPTRQHADTLRRSMGIPKNETGVVVGL